MTAFEKRMDDRINICVKKAKGELFREEIVEVVNERVGALRAMENKTDEEILEILTVHEILNSFRSCSHCGSYLGNIHSTSMNEEFDCGPIQSVFVCAKCKKSTVYD